MTKKLKILIVAGDGIGPEVMAEAVGVLKSVAEMGGYDFAFREELIGGVAIKAHGSPLPDGTLKAALDSDAVLLGAVGSNEFNALPPSQRPEAGLLKIRAALGGFANPVSYTHLDVYKRQVLKIAECSEVLRPEKATWSKRLDLSRSYFFFLPH